MRGIRLTSAFLVCFALIGCSGSKGFSDIDRFMKEVDEKPRGKIKELPTLQVYRAFSYSAAASRSPFLPPQDVALQEIELAPEQDDVNITRDDIYNNYQAFNFNSVDDIDLYEKLLSDGFNLISDALAELDQIFVDTKFEFGYVTDKDGNDKLIYMDEVGTPDSSRIWDGPSYRNGKVIENSKEVFRQLLLNHFPDPDILLNKDRMEERYALARDNALPTEMLMKVSETYLGIAEKITGKALQLSDNPKAEIVEILSSQYGLIG